MITILGATGYTGRQCAAEAVRAGLPVQLAGRRRDALERLAEELSISGTEVADVSDRAALARLASQSRVLVTTVGPYARLGQPVLEAAIAGGCHYVDVSGEVSHLAWAYDQHDRAVDAGVAICPGFGFDGVFGELLAAHAAERLAAPPSAARIAYRVERARPSRGTLRSSLGVVAGGGRAWIDGRLVTEPLARERWVAPFPLPEGPRPCVSVPLPEVVTVAHSTGARQVRTFGALPGPAGLARAAATALRPASSAAAALLRPPVRNALDRFARVLPEGPAESLRAQARTVVVAELTGAAEDRQQVRMRAWARVGDIYAVTARLAVGAAGRLLEDTPAHGALAFSQLGKPSELLDEYADDWSDY